MSDDPTKPEIFIQPLTGTDDDPADWIPGAWQRLPGLISMDGLGSVDMTWDGDGTAMTWNPPPDWKMTATTHAVIGDGHPDTLFESMDYPTGHPGFWALTPWTTTEEAFMRVVSLKDVTHTVGEPRAGVVSIEVHGPAQAQYPQMTSIFQHPSPEYVREIARQLLTGERRAYVQPVTGDHDNTMAKRPTAWHRTPVYFVKLWQWSGTGKPHPPTVLRLDRPLPQLASVATWPLMDKDAWPAEDVPVVEADLEDVPWLRDALGDTT